MFNFFKKKPLIELNLKVLYDKGNPKNEIEISCSRAGYTHLPTVITSLCNGVYIHQILNAIESNESKESIDAVKEIDKLFLMTQQLISQKQQTDEDGDILPSEALGGL